MVQTNLDARTHIHQTVVVTTVWLTASRHHKNLFNHDQNTTRTSLLAKEYFCEFSLELMY